MNWINLDFIDLFLHLDRYLAQWVVLYGPWIYGILFAVIFCETGLVVTPFLPGDSLLFIAGTIASAGQMDPFLLIGILSLAAMGGDSTNYVVGRFIGEKLFADPHSKIFRRDFLERTHLFYEHHGGKTVAMGRFVPIIRTFSPFVAGVSQMPYGRFFSFSVLGTLLWVWGLVGAGFLLGHVEFIKKNLSLMAVGIVILSFSPVLVQSLYQKRSRCSE